MFKTKYRPPRAPKSNGKVERSHRNNNKKFYHFLMFNFLEELRKKYLERANKMPMTTARYKTPLKKRKELLF